MESPRKLGKFSSCRGVSFEMKSLEDSTEVLSDEAAAKSEQLIPLPGSNSSPRFWLPRHNNPHPATPNLFKRLPYSEAIQSAMSPASSHFCDLEFSDDDEETDMDQYSEKEFMFFDVEKQNQGSISSSSTSLTNSKCHQQQQAAFKAVKQRQSRLWVLLLDQGLFTVYKRLFLVCLALNITGLVLAATGKFEYAKERAALFSIGNILALTMCRSEAFLRFVFWLAVSILGRSRVPLCVKTCTTSFLQCLGGVHSSCGVSSIAWLIYAIVVALNDRANSSPEIIMVSYAILGLLCLTSLAAFPLVRHLHHNVFERTHRFSGWAGLSLLWTFIMLTISYEPKSKSYSDKIWSRLIKQQEFWLTLSITILIILPWITVRRVPVKVTAPSGHASIIKFEGGIKSGILGRISRSPFSEWHAFGIISDGKEEHMMLAGAVGDFTKSLVANPPSHLWVRTVRFSGLPYLVHMYSKVVLVATGSGICVFLSFLLQPSKVDVCLIWVAKGIELNFGKEIMEIVTRYPKEKVIVHDTAILGRPDVSKMSVDAAKKWGAEVVIVTSNPEGSRDVVNSCKAAGFAAFGPIWDS